MPPVSRYLPSALWYGSVLVPRAIRSPPHLLGWISAPKPLDRVDLHDDLRIEILGHVEAEVFVGRSGKAVGAGVTAALGRGSPLYWNPNRGGPGTLLMMVLAWTS